MSTGPVSEKYLTPLERFGPWLLGAYAVSAALSIGLIQGAVLGFVALWVWERLFKPSQFAFPAETTLPILLWFLLVVVSSATGPRAGPALATFLKSAPFLLLPFAAADFFSRGVVEHRVIKYLALIVGSQCVAALHSILSTALGHELAPGVPGPVTESGQLAVILPLLFSLWVWTQQRSAERVKLTAICLVTLLLGILVAWPEIVGVSASTKMVAQIGFGALLLAIAMYQGSSFRVGGFTPLFFRYFPICLGLLGAAFIVNLKRGPWFAVMIVVVMIAAKRSLRTAATIAVLIAGTLLFLPPVRERAHNIVADFTIEGGRGRMWSLGADLVARFPLGLGHRNARMMRELDPSLPESHRHMHNNLLNLAVENGVLGAATFVWWIFVMIKLPLRRYWSEQASPTLSVGAALALGIAAAIASSQLAGLVEYNLGDGEVRILLLLCMGAGLALSLPGKVQESLENNQNMQ